jgi:hypothetical protein
MLSKDVTLTPSRVWHNPSTDRQQSASLRPSLLGLSMRLCDPGEALGQVWHILEVLEGSPAEVSLLSFRKHSGSGSARTHHYVTAM